MPALSEAELDELAERLLTKMLERLARRQQASNDRPPPAKREPSPEAYASVLAWKRRHEARKKR
jgi:hypothetical protein